MVEYIWHNVCQLMWFFIAYPESTQCYQRRHVVIFRNGNACHVALRCCVVCRVMVTIRMALLGTQLYPIFFGENNNEAKKIIDIV